MSEEEIMIRAREAAVVAYRDREEEAVRTRSGAYDDATVVQSAVRALRDLSKPLSELQPVDPDLGEAEKLSSELQADPALGPYMGPLAVLRAIKRGRELQKEAGQ